MTRLAADSGDITLVPNGTWANQIPGLKALSGQILGVLVLVCIVAFIGSALVWAGARIANMNMNKEAESALVKTLIAAILIGSMAGLVQWSTSQSLGFGSFRVNGKESKYDMDVCNIEGSRYENDCD